MPTYEFRCPQGHEFEKFYRTISGAEAQSACPACGALSERMMSATGFAFKGSGFYLTDYGKNAHREKGTSAPAGASGGGEGSKGEGGKAEGGSADGGGKSESAPASPAPSAAGDGGKAAAKPAAEAKAAPAPAKKSSGE